jgi:hypothetical protein
MIYQDSVDSKKLLLATFLAFLIVVYLEQWFTTFCIQNMAIMIFKFLSPAETKLHWSWLLIEAALGLLTANKKH